MMTRSSTLAVIAVIAVSLIATATAGCGTTEKSGNLGDTLTAKGLRATVLSVDDSVPVPSNDITGLSNPSPGSKLVGARVRVCSDHGGAIGPFDFGVETSAGEQGKLRFPEQNYADGLDTIRNGCGSGWVVFEIPRNARPREITFGFEDTASSQHPQNQVDARFSWSVSR